MKETKEKTKGRETKEKTKEEMKTKMHTYIALLEVQAILSAEHFTLPPQKGYSTQPWCEDSRKPPTYPCRVGLDMSAL